MSGLLDSDSFNVAFSSDDGGNDKGDDGDGRQDSGANNSAQDNATSNKQVKPRKRRPLKVLASNPATWIAYIVMHAVTLIVFTIMLWIDSIDFIITFVVVIVLSSITFWWTKNCAGKDLIQMRWWTKKAADKSHKTWILRIDPQRNRCTKIERRTFWGVLIVALAYYSLTLVGAIISIFLLQIEISRTLLAAICTALYWTNFIGYFKCLNESKMKKGGIKGIAKQAAIDEGTRAIQENPDAVINAARKVATENPDLAKQVAGSAAQAVMGGAGQ